MYRVRKIFQYVFIGVIFVIFSKLKYSPFKVTLFVILTSIVLQQFLLIFNSEISEKKIKATEGIKNDVAKAVLVLLLELVLIFIVYYLSNSLFKN